MSYLKTVILTDENGVPLHANADADGDLHLGTSVIQEIISSSNNSTLVNLASGAVFTGIADETFGINGIQVYHFADQDCTIELEQSLDAVNWDVNDSYSVIANTVFTETISSVAPYYRAKITNNGGSATTAMRFATGMTPIINTLPRALTEYDRLKVEASFKADVGGIRTQVTPFGKMKVVNPSRLIGTDFIGTTKDTNFWTEAVTGTGAVAQAGEITLSTGITADSTAQYQSIRRARHAAGTANEFKFTGRLITAPAADNIRRCGIYDDDNGCFFQVDGVTLGVVTRKSSVDTVVSSGSFNGDYGPGLAMTTAMENFVIWYWERTIYFFVSGKLLHKIQATTGSLVDTMDLPIRMENINENGNITDHSFMILVTTVFRLGDLNTESIYKYISTNATIVLKQGAGRLHKVIVVDNKGLIKVYDNTAGSGAQIAEIDGAKVLGTLEFDIPFSNGLTIVTSGDPKITITYE